MYYVLMRRGIFFYLEWLQVLLVFVLLIVSNVGVEGDVVVEKILDFEWVFGYNVMLDKYENFLELGVIDLVKVIRCVL